MPTPGKDSCNRLALPILHCMLGVSGVFILHRTLTWTTRSFTCAQLLMYAVAPKVDSGTIPGRTGESNLRQRRADPTLYQLSYIPMFSSLEKPPMLFSPSCPHFSLFLSFSMLGPFVLFSIHVLFSSCVCVVDWYIRVFLSCSGQG